MWEVGSVVEGFGSLAETTASIPLECVGKRGDNMYEDV